MHSDSDREYALSLFQKILLSTDGTVTDLIALYTGEPIHVTKITQEVTEAPAPFALQCGAFAKLLVRKILLTGTTKNYLYADSIFVFDRFAPSIQRQLLTTDRPIGLLWKEARLETFREVVDQDVAPSPDIAAYFDLASTAPFVSRTYLIHHGGQPLGSITEKWPLTYFTPDGKP